MTGCHKNSEFGRYIDNLCTNTFPWVQETEANNE